ncbi:MAG: c-type cytochrome biogenesis protein CcmI [Betaproteobacteria bacterium]|nr:c-type cytochrome biogenesis protein CcmI [Betaproteobacteria bacterium]
MTGFLIAACAMLCAALGFLLPPLLRRPWHEHASVENATHDLVELYRQQVTEVEGDLSSGLLAAGHHQEARRELERRMLEDLSQGAPMQATQWRMALKTALGMLVLLPLAAALLYGQLGNPGAMSAPPAGSSAMQAGPHATSPAQIAMMVDQLAQKLADDPDNPDGWAMLARSYDVLGRYRDAVAAFKRAEALLPDDAALLADYADTVAMTQRGRLRGKPMQLVHRALKVDPDNPKALALAGTDAFDRRDYRGAATFWEKALKAAPEGTEFTAGLRANLEEARSLAGDRSRPAMATPESTQAVAAQISGRVTLSTWLREKAPPDGTLFVFARAESGPRMPLAILQANVKALPMEFILDDKSSMSPTLKLSNFDRVIVSARISRSGDALPRSGDLIGSSGPVPVGTRNLQIEIGETVK